MANKKHTHTKSQTLFLKQANQMTDNISDQLWYSFHPTVSIMGGLYKYQSGSFLKTSNFATFCPVCSSFSYFWQCIFFCHISPHPWCFQHSFLLAVFCIHVITNCRHFPIFLPCFYVVKTHFRGSVISRMPLKLQLYTGSSEVLLQTCRPFSHHCPTITFYFKCIFSSYFRVYADIFPTGK